MYTSWQDPQRLLVIQQAAGYLNLSVDELLQQQRAPPPSESSLTLGASGSRPNYAQNDSLDDDGQLNTFVAHGNDATFWQSDHGGNADYGTSQQQDGNQLLMMDLPSFGPEQPIFDGHPPPHAFLAAPQEDVILLNPEIENAWYACNMDYQVIKLGDISGSDRNNSSGTDGFVKLAPHSHGSDGDSESTARDGDVDMSSGDDDGDGAPSVPTPANSQSSSSLGNRQYKLIAPRPGTVKLLPGGSDIGVSVPRVRKKRAPYSASRRLDTNLTRSLNACVRCRIQRNRVRAGFS